MPGFSVGRVFWACVWGAVRRVSTNEISESAGKLVKILLDSHTLFDGKIQPFFSRKGLEDGLFRLWVGRWGTGSETYQFKISPEPDTGTDNNHKAFDPRDGFSEVDGRIDGVRILDLVSDGGGSGVGQGA